MSRARDASSSALVAGGGLVVSRCKGDMLVAGHRSIDKAWNVGSMSLFTVGHGCSYSKRSNAYRDEDNTERISEHSCLMIPSC